MNTYGDKRRLQSFEYVKKECILCVTFQHKTNLLQLIGGQNVGKKKIGQDGNACFKCALFYYIVFEHLKHGLKP